MYGMDKDADGVVDFAEIQAYEKYKKELLAKANSAEEARRMPARRCVLLLRCSPHPVHMFPAEASSAMTASS